MHYVECDAEEKVAQAKEEIARWYGGEGTGIVVKNKWGKCVGSGECVVEAAGDEKTLEFFVAAVEEAEERERELTEAERGKVARIARETGEEMEVVERCFVEARRNVKRTKEELRRRREETLEK